MTSGKLIGLGIATTVLYLSLYIPDSPGSRVALFIVVNALAFVPLVVVFRVFIRKSESVSDERALMLILLFGMAFRLALVPLDPVASDDIYRYVWDGKVALSGTNPFALAPSDPRLSDLYTVDLPSKINFPDMRTIYPPFAQVFFAFSNLLFGDSVSGIKLLLVLCDLGTMILLVVLLRRIALPPAMVVLYAWSPVPIMYIALDGHIDALGIPLLLLAVYLVMKERRILGSATMGLAGLAKLYPMFVVPQLFQRGKNVKKNAVVVLPLLVFGIGCWAYVEPTGGLVESFKVFTSQFEFNGSVFSLMKFVTGMNVESRIVCAIIFSVWILMLVFLDRTLIEKTFLGFLGFVILSPVVHPWYLTWLAALIVVRWSPAVFSLLILSNLSNIVVYEYRTSGVWADNPVVLLLEYLPFFALLMWELSRGRTRFPLVQSS